MLGSQDEASRQESDRLFEPAFASRQVSSLKVVGWETSPTEVQPDLKIIRVGT